MLHTLGKLANVKEIASNLCVIVVNIAAEIAFRLTVTVGHNDALSVRDTEQLFIVAVNKANIPAGFFDVLVQPFLHIAEAVEVIITSDRNTTKQKRILLGIGSKAELCGVVALYFAVLICPPKRTHSDTILEQSVFLGSQGVDYSIQVLLERIAFPLRAGIKPSGVKPVIVRTEVPTQMSDVAGLSLKLRALGIAVLAFGNGHWAQCKICHYRSLLSWCVLCFGMSKP